MKRPALVYGLTWFVALSLAAWIFRQLPLSAISTAVAGLTLEQWLIWIMTNLVVIGLCVLRWQLLSGAIGINPGFIKLLHIRQAGQAVSFITPGPQFGGEPLQVYWLWKKFGIPGHQALLAVGLDRFYELWINLAVLLVGVLLLLVSPAFSHLDWLNAFIGLSSMVMLLTWLGWWLSHHPQKISTWMKRLEMRWQDNPRLRNIDAHWDQLAGKLRHIVDCQKGKLLLAFLMSLLSWTGMIAEIWLLLLFLGLDVGFSGFIFLLVAMRLAFLLPLPGGIGTLEASVFWCFQVLHLPLEGAIGFIALMRLRDAIVLAYGLITLRRLSTNAL